MIWWGQGVGRKKSDWVFTLEKNGTKVRRISLFCIHLTTFRLRTSNYNHVLICSREQKMKQIFFALFCVYFFWPTILIPLASCFTWNKTLRKVFFFCKPFEGFKDLLRACLHLLIFKSFLKYSAHTSLPFSPMENRSNSQRPSFVHMWGPRVLQYHLQCPHDILDLLQDLQFHSVINLDWMSISVVLPDFQLSAGPEAVAMGRYWS